MRRQIEVGVFLIYLLGVQDALRAAPARPSAKGPTLTSFKKAAKAFVATGCEDQLWTHVYHRQRLKLVEKCIAVTGTISHVKKEPDGDDHIQLKVDTQFEGLLNNGNRTAQRGTLIVEPVCQGPVTQADAQAACLDFHPAVQVPAQGKHVRVLGSYVYDSAAGHGWMEIHPVTSIEEGG